GVDHGEQHGRVHHTLFDVGGGRAVQQPRELGGVGGGAVLVVPGAAEGELLVAHHVQRRRRADDGPVEVGALGERGADEQAAVGAAHDREPVGGGVTCVDQRGGSGVQVVEDVLLVGAVAGEVPLLALLAAAAQGDQRERAAGLDPGERRRGVGGLAADAEAAVAGDERGPRAVRV